MQLHIFNPDTDMALRHNTANYLPTDAVKRFAYDLSLLPAWFAPQNSILLSPDTSSAASFLECMKKRFPLSTKTTGWDGLSSLKLTGIQPWGWNATLRHRLACHGTDNSLLPDDSTLSHLRKMASRQYAAQLTAYFDRKHPYWCGESQTVTSMDEIIHYVEKHTEGCLFKLLWSSSGKGLRWCYSGLDKHAEHWCAKALTTDGALMAEPVYNKVEDLAAEFISDGKGSVTFLGYSRFITNRQGAYMGNLIAPDPSIVRWISEYLPYTVVQQAIKQLQLGLSELYGHRYAGHMGVDMMICRNHHNNPPYLLHPHVEVNLRMNMGIAARLIQHRFLAPDATGLFAIESAPQPDDLQARHQEDIRTFPLIIENGKVLSGHLPLTPILPDSRYRAFIRIKN